MYYVSFSFILIINWVTIAWIWIILSICNRNKSVIKGWEIIEIIIKKSIPNSLLAIQDVHICSTKSMNIKQITWIIFSKYKQVLPLFFTQESSLEDSAVGCFHRHAEMQVAGRVIGECSPWHCLIGGFGKLLWKESHLRCALEMSAKNNHALESIIIIILFQQSQLYLLNWFEITWLSFCILFC